MGLCKHKALSVGEPLNESGLHVSLVQHIFFIFMIDLIWKFSSGVVSIPLLLVLGLVSTACDWE